MSTLQDYLNQVRALIHDTNSADFTDAVLTNFINQARARVAMDTHCVRGFLSVTGGSALNTIAGQENYAYSGGALGGATLVLGGSGYVTPEVEVVGAGSGSGAAASAVMSGGVITAINVTNWGGAYTSGGIFNVTDSTGPGSGAYGNGTLLSNVLDILSVAVLWGNDRIAFKWCPFTMFQTYFRSQIGMQGVPSVFTIHQGIQQVFLSRIPDQAYTMEWDIITLPNPLVNGTDVDLQVVPPCSDAVQLFAAHLAIASLQNYAMADYWYSGNPNNPGKYDRRIVQLAATGFCRRIPNPYRSYLKRLRRM